MENHILNSIEIVIVTIEVHKSFFITQRFPIKKLPIWYTENMNFTQRLTVTRRAYIAEEEKSSTGRSHATGRLSISWKVCLSNEYLGDNVAGNSQYHSFYGL